MVPVPMPAVELCSEAKLFGKASTGKPAVKWNVGTSSVMDRRSWFGLAFNHTEVSSHPLRFLPSSSREPASRAKIIFFATQENNHGTKIFEKGVRQSRARDERAQGRHSEELSFRQQAQ